MTRHVQVLFLLSLVGVLVVLDVLVWVLGGPVAGGVLAVVALGLLAYGAQRARAAAAPPPRTCSCCTTTVHDPVQVR